jgi:hypothetical protein
MVDARAHFAVPERLHRPCDNLGYGYTKRRGNGEEDWEVQGFAVPPPPPPARL